MTDLPALNFVDPNAVDQRWRIVLFGAPGTGKTVGAVSAPGPIIAMSADRPGAYRYARHHHGAQTVQEARFVDSGSLRALYDHARNNQTSIGTVVLDPWNAMYDQLVRENTTMGGKPNWSKINDLALDIIHGFRALDVNLVIVAHERRDQDENADTEAKVFPQLGGPALVQKVMAEVDIVARVFRRDDEETGTSEWMGQVATARGYQCKDSTGVLGRVAPLNLTAWIDAANESLGAGDLPFDAEEPSLEEHLLDGRGDAAAA